MNDLKKINNYISRLNKVTNDLKILDSKLKENPPVDEWEELYQREFFLSMQVADIHETIHLLIDGLDETDEMVKKRLRREADKIFTPLVLTVGE
jgi:hypothetical protein